MIKTFGPFKLSDVDKELLKEISSVHHEAKWKTQKINYGKDGREMYMLFTYEY